jgi:hypothetical protein
MTLRPVLSDLLADLHVLQLPNHPRADDQANQQRGD